MLKDKWEQDVWRTIFPSAIEIEYGGRYPADFCIIDYFISRTISSWFNAGPSHPLVPHYATLLAPGQPPYVILYALAIVFFCFFYTALVFNSRETADNLKKSGAFVPG